MDMGDNGLGQRAAASLAPLLLRRPPVEDDDLFLLPGEEDVHALQPTARRAIRELRLARNGPSFNGAACATLLAPPRSATDGTLALTSLASVE